MPRSINACHVSNNSLRPAVDSEAADEEDIGPYIYPSSQRGNLIWLIAINVGLTLSVYPANWFNENVDYEMSNARFILILLVCIGAAFGGVLFMLGGLQGLFPGASPTQAAALPGGFLIEATDPAQVVKQRLNTKAEQERDKLRQNLVLAHAALSTDFCDEKAQAGFISATQAYFERYNTEIPSGTIANLTGQARKARNFWLTHEDLKIRKLVDAAAAENLIVSHDFTVPLDNIRLGKSRISPPGCRV